MTDRDDDLKAGDFDALEGFFRAARAAAPEPGAALMARILADAEAAQAPAAVPATPARPAPRGGFWAALMSALGGLGGVAGLASAMLAGVWLGFAQPASISGLTNQVIGEMATLDQVDLIPSIGVDLTGE